MNKKRHPLIVMASGVVVVAMASPALAYWSSRGNGSATARTFCP